MATTLVLSCGNMRPSPPFPAFPRSSVVFYWHTRRRMHSFDVSNKRDEVFTSRNHQSWAMFIVPCAVRKGRGLSEDGNPGMVRLALQSSLWAAEAAYILWLFLLPYAPLLDFRVVKAFAKGTMGLVAIIFSVLGDPVWAIKSGTISDLIGLSLNFFFILPLLNSAGIPVIEAPVLHPMAEGLFNFVIGWTFLFAPLLFTDVQRDRYKGSLDLLWGFQMFLTNTFLIPYMAIRLNDADMNQSPPQPSSFASVMTIGAPIVGIIGGAVCAISAFWAFLGRPDGSFGGVADRWNYFSMYVGSERLAYAFIWDMILYSIFQPWLIGDNLQNVQQSDAELVRKLRFVPVVGLVAYLLSLDVDKEV